MRNLHTVVVTLLVACGGPNVSPDGGLDGASLPDSGPDAFSIDTTSGDVRISDVAIEDAPDSFSIDPSDSLSLSQTAVSMAVGYIDCVEVSLLHQDGTSTVLPEGTAQWQLADDAFAQVLAGRDCFVGTSAGTTTATATLESLPSARIAIDARDFELRFALPERVAVGVGRTLEGHFQTRATTEPRMAPGEPGPFVVYEFESPIVEWVDHPRRPALRGLSAGTTTMRARYSPPGLAPIAFDGTTTVRVFDVAPVAVTVDLFSVRRSIPGSIDQGDCLDVIGYGTHVDGDDHFQAYLEPGEAEFVSPTGTPSPPRPGAMARFCYGTLGPASVTLRALGLEDIAHFVVVDPDANAMLRATPESLIVSFEEFNSRWCPEFRVEYVPSLGEPQDVTNEPALRLAITLGPDALSASPLEEEGGGTCYWFDNAIGAEPPFSGEMQFGYALTFATVSLQFAE